MDAYGSLAEKMQNTKLLTEVIETYEDEEDDTNWYDEYKALEQSSMVKLDEYHEVARALGFEGRGLWGDVCETHKAIVDRAKQLRAFYDDHKS